MSKNYLKSKDSKVKFIQSILQEIHNDINFSARDHKYKVKRDVLTKDGVVEKEVSPYSVSSFVANNFGHFNEKNWDIPANKSGISKEDLIYNRLLAQVMGCVKGSIIHDYLENFAKGEAVDINQDLASVIREETSYNFYPLQKESNNLIRRINRNIEFNKHTEESIKKDIFKTYPEFPKGTLALELTSLNNINKFVKEVCVDLSNQKFNNHKDLTNYLTKTYNFPENVISELNEYIDFNLELTQEDYFKSFSSLQDNEFLEKKEFLYKASLISLSNEFIKLDNLNKNINNLSQDNFVFEKQNIQAKIREKSNTLNQMFLLNPEVTAKTIQELKSEEYRLNKDISFAVKEVFENLNAGKMIEKLDKIGITLIAVEQKMSLKAVIGTADLIGMTKEGQVVILDYKTNKGNLSKDSLEHYSFQLRIYEEMIKTLITEKIKNDPKLQNKASKVFGCNYEKALEIICKKSDPILLHISSVDKVKDSDIAQIKAIGMRELLEKMKSMEFDNSIEQINYFNIEGNKLNKEINKIKDGVDSCKLIYTPTLCTQYDKENNKAVDYSVEKLVNDVFNTSIHEIREPKKHFYSTKLDLVIPDTEHNREVINNLDYKENFNKEDIIKSLNATVIQPKQILKNKEELTISH